VAESIRAVDDRDGIGRSRTVLNVCLKGVLTMNKTTRHFSFANASFLAVALAAAMMIASSRSASAQSAPAVGTERAAKIFSATGINGGVIVYLGATDGKSTAALKINDHCCVQGLTTDRAACDAARQYIQSRGLYGAVSVEPYDGKHLPYVDNLAALVVVDDPGVPMAEVMRVLRPLGAAVVNRAGQDQVTIKPWPKEYDEWQQHYHGPDNNAVAHDTAVGPPRHYQWIACPEWQRSHLILPSMNSLISSRSRLYTVEDVASAEHTALPGKYALICRDAFSGIELWRVPFPDWHSTLIYDKDMPVQLQRRCAAIGDTVYCTPGYFAPVTAFDAATGAVKKKYDGTRNTTEFVYDRGTLYVVTGEPTYPQGEHTDALGSSKFAAKLYGPPVITFRNPKCAIAAIDATTGRTLWKKSGQDTAGYLGATLGIVGDHVVLYTGAGVTAWERATGKTLWSTPAPVSFQNTSLGTALSLVLSKKAAFLADGKQLRAFRLSDGKQLWSVPDTFNHHKAPDVFLTGGLVWAAGYNANTGRPAPQWDLSYVGIKGYNPDTGKLVKEIPQQMTRPMGHDRCYRNRITDSYYIDTATGGSDYLQFGTDTEFPNPWVRGTCGIGILPCNGMLYAGPPSCSCCNWVMLNALNALTPEPKLAKSDGPIQVTPVNRLEKGPAFGAAVGPAASPADWPTYRHDGVRSGVSKINVGRSVSPRWAIKLTGRPSAPVIAAGTLFVADIDAHQLCAFNAQTSRPLWKFSAGSRIDSPPAYADGFVYFGSRDGAVYSLRASDGALAWRFRPLPSRVICAYGQLESAWPVDGTVLLKDGLVYFAAGRNSFLDGGIFVYALDMKTGEVRHQRRMCGPFGEDGFPILTAPDFRAAMGIYGFKADVPVDGGTCVYFKQQAFLPDLTPVKQTAVKNRHLIPNPGFLESIPQNRTFWTLDTVTRYDIPTGLAGVHGDIMVVDGNRFIEVRGYTPSRQKPFDPRVSGYTLYCGIAGERGSAAAGADASRAKRRGKGKNAGRRNAAARRRANLLAQAAAATPSKEIWESAIPLTGKAIARSENVVFVAGTPVVFPKGDVAKAYEGRMGGMLWLADAATGKKLAEYPLPAPPVWDSLAVADGSVYIALTDGRLLCFAGK
jgi:outer membrane protein assembly factor BamB